MVFQLKKVLYCTFFNYICHSSIYYSLMNPKNNTSVIGTIADDAQIYPPTKSKPNQILSFDIFINDKYQNPTNGEIQTRTTWYKIVMFFPKKKPIKMVDYLKKGKLIAASGTVSADVWINKEGEADYKLKLIVSSGDLKLL